MKVLDLTEASDFYEIGYLHGCAVRAEIRECTEKLTTLFGEYVDELKRLFREETEYLENIRTYLPNVYKEFCGICDGAEIEQEDLLLLNCLDECYLLLNERNLVGHCTSFGIRQEGGAILLGQNLDFLQLFDGYQIRIQMKSPINGMYIETLGFAGQIFGIGMNQQGIAVVSTTILNGAYQRNKGIPNTFVQKALLYTETMEEALEVLKGCPVSTATSWTIAAPGMIVCVETTAHKVLVFPQSDIYVHTNHALYSEDVVCVKNVCDEKGFLLHDGKSWELTLERKDFMEKAVKEKPSVEKMCHILSQPPIQRVDTSVTLLSVVMEMGEKEEIMWYRGSDASQEYVKIKRRTGEK